MTFKQLADTYCSRQVCTAEQLKQRLTEQAIKFQPEGWALMECHMMDSSALGSLWLAPYGPNNTLKEPPTTPLSPNGLASNMSVCIGILKATELGKK